MIFLLKLLEVDVVLLEVFRQGLEIQWPDRIIVRYLEVVYLLVGVRVEDEPVVAKVSLQVVLLIAVYRFHLGVIHVMHHHQRHRLRAEYHGEPQVWLQQILPFDSANSVLVVVVVGLELC